MADIRARLSKGFSQILPHLQIEIVKRSDRAKGSSFCRDVGCRTHFRLVNRCAVGQGFRKSRPKRARFLHLARFVSCSESLSELMNFSDRLLAFRDSSITKQPECYCKARWSLPSSRAVKARPMSIRFCYFDRLEKSVRTAFISGSLSHFAAPLRLAPRHSVEVQDREDTLSNQR